jgi:hypothetical protein
MRATITLLICLLSFSQVQATTYARASAPCQLTTQSDHHSKPVNQKQENQEEDEITDEDQDFSDESIYSMECSLLPDSFHKNILINFYLVRKTNAHVNPILTPPDCMP